MENEQKLFKTLVSGLEYQLEVSFYREEDKTWQRVICTVSDLPFLRTKRLKPHLRSLDKIIEEIEHNGKKFVPQHYGFWTKGKKVGDSILLNDISTGSFAIQDNLEMIQQLHEWHFNVYDLPKEMYIEIK